MAVKLNPYLSFRDNGLEAMQFYQSVLGGELQSMTFEQFGAGTPGEAGKLMHAELVTPTGMTLMASDTPDEMELKAGNSISVSLSGDDEPTLRDYWDKLSDGAMIMMPFERAPWGDIFGMCIDKFGVTWLVNVNTAPRDAGGQ